MRGKVLIAVLAVLAGVAGLAASAPAATAPNTDWSALLPALPSPKEPQPGPVPYCRKPSIDCVSTQARRLRELRDRLGCDHRAVFATTYLTLTRVLRKLVREQPDFIRHERYLYWQDALFADVYFNTVWAWERGADVPQAWRIAFETARNADVNAAQDMLLGINAHVQNDMPFVIAALGVRTPGGESRKPDHDAINEALNQAYQPVIDAVTSRYDPQVGTTNSNLTPVDDAAGLELAREWREAVWRNAERLLNAESTAEREQVAQQIEDNAAWWARGIAAMEQPGYRTQRDAYCEEQLGE